MQIRGIGSNGVLMEWFWKVLEKCMFSWRRGMARILIRRCRMCCWLDCCWTFAGLFTGRYCWTVTGLLLDSSWTVVCLVEIEARGMQQVGGACVRGSCLPTITH